jgi:signal transduction histidine kinase
MISLQKRLTLTYGIFICLALTVLAVVVNRFTEKVFTGLVRENIAETSRAIVSSMGNQYKPMEDRFDAGAVEAVGMYFVHEGYIISLEDLSGDPVWDARSCDMEQCIEVINTIAERMKNLFNMDGALERQRYPVLYNGRTVGNVNIESYGPFFYSETETIFITSINRLLIAAVILFTLLSALISVLLSRTIASPILKAGAAARKIAALHSGGGSSPLPCSVSTEDTEKPPPGADPQQVRIRDSYRTKELAYLSRAINELAAELEEGERRQKQLSADVAHELRTPLSCLRGNVEAMIDGVYKSDREHLESCHEEIMRLTRLVEDLSTLTSLEWNKITLNKLDLDLAKLLQLTAEQFRPAAAEKGIRMELNLMACSIRADYDRLKQIFINILSNAVKYTEKGSITITMRSDEKTDEKNPAKTMEVSVADTGMGIAEEDLPHIFERFYRSDKSRNRSTGGAGIGLAIAAAICSAHGGSITAESGGAGSVFRVRLPLYNQS